MASGEWRIIASIPSCRNLTRCSRLDLKAVYKQSSDTTLLTRAGNTATLFEFTLCLLLCWVCCCFVTQPSDSVGGCTFACTALAMRVLEAHLRALASTPVDLTD